MKKAKLNRMQIDILKMSKANDLMVMRAGVELIMKCTVNYFECEDTAFYKPYMQTATWAMQFFDRFYEKLVDGEFINPEIFAIAESKFNYLVSQAITLKHRNIGFNLLNEREKGDHVYYEYMSASEQVLKALVYITSKKGKVPWAEKYFKMISIQIRSICKIFENELNYVKPAKKRPNQIKSEVLQKS